MINKFNSSKDGKINTKNIDHEFVDKHFMSAIQYQNILDEQSRLELIKSRGYKFRNSNILIKIKMLIEDLLVFIFTILGKLILRIFNALGIIQKFESFSLFTKLITILFLSLLLIGVIIYNSTFIIEIIEKSIKIILLILYKLFIYTKNFVIFPILIKFKKLFLEILGGYSEEIYKNNVNETFDILNNSINLTTKENQIILEQKIKIINERIDKGEATPELLAEVKQINIEMNRIEAVLNVQDVTNTAMNFFNTKLGVKIEELNEGLKKDKEGLKKDKNKFNAFYSYSKNNLQNPIPTGARVPLDDPMLGLNFLDSEFTRKKILNASSKYIYRTSKFVFDRQRLKEELYEMVDTFLLYKQNFETKKTQDEIICPQSPEWRMSLQSRNFDLKHFNIHRSVTYDFYRRLRDLGLSSKIFDTHPLKAEKLFETFLSNKYKHEKAFDEAIINHQENLERNILMRQASIQKEQKLCEEVKAYNLKYIKQSNKVEDRKIQLNVDKFEPDIKAKVLDPNNPEHYRFYNRNIESSKKVYELLREQGFVDDLLNRGYIGINDIGIVKNKKTHIQLRQEEENYNKIKAKLDPIVELYENRNPKPKINKSSEQEYETLLNASKKLEDLTNDNLNKNNNFESEEFIDLDKKNDVVKEEKIEVETKPKTPKKKVKGSAAKTKNAELKEEANKLNEEEVKVSNKVKKSKNKKAKKPKNKTTKAKKVVTALNETKNSSVFEITATNNLSSVVKEIKSSNVELIKDINNKKEDLSRALVLKDKTIETNKQEFNSNVIGRANRLSIKNRNFIKIQNIHDAVKFFDNKENIKLLNEKVLPHNINNINIAVDNFLEEDPGMKEKRMLEWFGPKKNIFQKVFHKIKGVFGSEEGNIWKDLTGQHWRTNFNFKTGRYEHIKITEEQAKNPFAIKFTTTLAPVLPVAPVLVKDNDINDTENVSNSKKVISKTFWRNIVNF